MTLMFFTTFVLRMGVSIRRRFRRILGVIKLRNMMWMLFILFVRLRGVEGCEYKAKVGCSVVRHRAVIHKIVK